MPIWNKANKQGKKHISISFSDYVKESILKEMHTFSAEKTSHILFFFLSFFFLFFFRATLMAYGCSQARGHIGATAASHSNARSEPSLWPTSQLMATLDPLAHWMRPGIESALLWFLVRFIFSVPWQELLIIFLICLLIYSIHPLIFSFQ